MARTKKLIRKSSVGDTSIHFPFSAAFYLGRTFVRILMSDRLSPSAFPFLAMTSWLPPIKQSVATQRPWKNTQDEWPPKTEWRRVVWAGLDDAAALRQAYLG